MGISPTQAAGESPGLEPKWLEGGTERAVRLSQLLSSGHTGGQLASMGKNLVLSEAKGV